MSLRNPKKWVSCPKCGHDHKVQGRLKARCPKCYTVWDFPEGIEPGPGKKGTPPTPQPDPDNPTPEPKKRLREKLRRAL